MSPSTLASAQDSWRSLWSELSQIRHYLEQHIARVHSSDARATNPQENRSSSEPESAIAPSNLEHLCNTFGLSPFERAILLLCVGMELDRTIAALCAEAQGDTQKPYPTFDLALAILPSAHWSALTPTAPLRRWRLIEMGISQTLMLSPLRVDEWILHYLTGTQCGDDRTLHLIQPVSLQPSLVSSHQQLANQLAALWQQGDTTHYPIAQLCGSESGSKQAIAAAACHQLGWQLHTLSALVLPAQMQDLQTLLTLWERTAALQPSVLLVDCDAIAHEFNSREDALTRLMEQIRSPLMIASRDRWPQQQRAFVSLTVESPTRDEQQRLWQQALGPVAASLNGQVEQLASQFRLNASTIQTICTEVIGDVHPPSTVHAAQSESLGQALWQVCRIHTRPQLDDLAQRIEAIATWNDLILPDKECAVLQTIAAHVNQRIRVYEQWGFRSKSSRGLGISALFAGVSGTGKTMSAEVLAHTLQLDLYRIDLSSVVSKYIGETEKNLRRIFDAAEASTVILLFDEADALFGKRSDVKDSHDRYANMEVSYLLQRMESYQGLAILTSNLKDSLDTAFLRRIRFVVKFPFPDIAQRIRIWQKIFPPQTPTHDLDFQKLAKLNVSGGNIRNIALNATFLAASNNEPVQMHHLRDAAYSEYMKLERTLTDTEVKGWVSII
ncbi:MULTISPECIES: ATP-binding protein [unclassified Leptolyngbya]|uniref:ATP-binding protein n=1 Tax=unclassified Leptolyngbya TaxID=2650499 RepID=UPI001689D3E9|nr:MULTISPECIES: ATP-binding protein [unclassified Leptolyngbya]MBD1909748.1 ATP-binding protein [Leptolyngbya sp. FACHB-8]MBD2157646.1 ATP-binding protein [Leptolyngbya sp. FACHB-16]